MASPIFSGANSLRHTREHLALLGVLLWAFPIAGLLGLVVHEEVDIPKIALFIVIAMIYVTLARGRLIGSSVMIHEAQYPRVFAIVKRACAALEIPMPLVFVREDYQVPIAALGFGEPYALVLSSHYIEHFEDNELAFIIGRQLGHIAAGHTRFISLLSVNGNENPIIALIFGPWLRTCELTCDKVGLLVCGSLEAAARAIAISSFHHFGRTVDMEQFAEQGREIAGDSILKWGEWLGAEPYATRRVAEMRKFATTHQYQVLEEWFLREAEEPPPALPSAGTVTVSRSDCAGWWRRFTATLIDLIVVVSVVSALGGSESVIQVHRSEPLKATASPAPAASGSHAKIKVWRNPAATPAETDEDTTTRTTSPADDANTEIAANAWFTFGTKGLQPGPALVPIVNAVGGSMRYWAYAVYFALLVGLSGQTFGMMITGLRVVTLDFRRPGLGLALWRYFIGFALFFIIVPISFFQHRILLHDRWSKTRLITAERAMARAATSKMAATAPA